MRCRRFLVHAVVVSFALIASAKRASGQSLERATFNCAIQNAFLLSPYVPPPFSTTSFARCGRWGHTDWNPDGSPKAIVLYTHSYLARTPSGTGGFSQSFLKGAILRTLIHELRHVCMGPMGGCHNAGMSCLHAMIDSYTHHQLCFAAMEALEDALAAEAAGDDETAEEKRGELAGACDSARQLEEKWNNDEGVGAVSACKNGTASCGLSQAQAQTASECGLSMPCPPEPGSGAPADELLTPCAACNG